MAKAPAVIYDGGLGWLFGHQFLLLTHRGRRSGRLHRTMVEVIRYQPESGAAWVVSGTGARADWYRNVRRGPRVGIQIGRERYAAEARLLDAQESRAALREFACRKPLEGRIAFLLGMADKPIVVFSRAQVSSGHAHDSLTSL
jgi:deazaflavin-dependent oxidoreductase (nitroreductase family)